MARGHKLMTAKLRKQLPRLYSGEEQGLAALAVVKYFCPWNQWTWYASEFDGGDICFGLVSGYEVELGYFSLSELEAIRGPLGLTIERDLHFKPTPLSELKQRHELARTA